MKKLIVVHNSVNALKNVCSGMGIQEEYGSITYRQKLVDGTTGKYGKETPETVFFY
jgi:hypothetical protein